MPKIECRKIGLAFDMAGCPNRCRHCWLGCPPNARMSEQTLRGVVSAFKGFKQPAASKPLFEGLQVQTWYREPDFSPDYRRLRDLELELSDVDIWGDMELLSVWRLAKDEGYAAWARDARGTRKCQITFFGTGANHDWFIRRRGAFDEALVATERLLTAGIIPRWQLFLTKRMVPDLGDLLALADDLHLRGRARDLGGDFVVFIHTPSPSGEGLNIEYLRPTARDIAAVPNWLIEATRVHFGGRDPFGEPESALVRKVLRGELEIPYGEPEPRAFFVDPRLNVYSNYGGPTNSWWSLGNLVVDSLSQIIRAFENEAAPGLQAAFHVPIQEMAERYGRKGGGRYYAAGDLRWRWMDLWCLENSPVIAPWQGACPQTTLDGGGRVG